MTDEARSRTFAAVVSAAKYWISIENMQCAASIISLLVQLDLTAFEKSEVNKTINIFNKVFSESGGYAAVMNSDEIKNSSEIPVNLNIDNDSRYYYIVGTVAMNFLSAKCFSEGYNILSVVADTWPELFRTIIELIRKSDFKDDFTLWCGTHAAIALDVANTKTLSFGSLAIAYDKSFEI